MAAARLFKPASRLLRQSTTPTIRLSPRSIALLSRTTTPSFISRRSYAVAAQKEYTVRDALNEALAEELESNEKVFILGEEVSIHDTVHGLTLMADCRSLNTMARIR